MPIIIPSTEAITQWNRNNTDGRGVVMNPGALQAAQVNPNRVIFGHEAINNWPQKVLEIIRDLAQAHPFQDGNKRTATWAVGEVYELNGVQVPPEIEDWVNRMTEENITRDEKRDILAEMNERDIPVGQSAWEDDDEPPSEGSGQSGSEEGGEGEGSGGEGEGLGGEGEGSGGESEGV